MAESLGNPEKAALFALMLAGEEVSTPELKKRHGIQLRKDTRVRLNEAELIVSRTEKSPHMHKITPDGVARCEDVLITMERPPGGSALLGVIFELLTPVVRYFRRHGIPLADVIHQVDVESTDVVDDLETMIRKAYEELSVKPQDWVRLAKLRPKLDGAGKDEVDRVLLGMAKTGEVHLAPDSNRKVLTDADHAAAIRIGSENKHLMAIEAS